MHTRAYMRLLSLVWADRRHGDSDGDDHGHGDDRGDGPGDSDSDSDYHGHGRGLRSCEPYDCRLRT